MTLRHISRRLVISFVTLLSLLGSTFTSYADSTPNEGSTIIYDVYVSGYAITDKNKDSIKFPALKAVSIMKQNLTRLYSKIPH